MGTIRPVEEGACQNQCNVEAGAGNTTNNGAQSSSTVENDLNIVKFRKKQKLSLLQYFRIYAPVFAVVAGVVVAGYFFVQHIGVFSIHGRSMEPALNDGDVAVVVQSKQYDTGDVVFFHVPESWKRGEEAKTIVKRIAGKPGDVLLFDGKKFIIGGKQYDLAQKYECTTQPYKTTIPAGKVFVLGDNKEVSIDSRYQFCHGNLEYFLVDEDSFIKFGKLLMKY